MDQRKELILTAVVEEYIRTAAPVGSKTISRRSVKASSATIRNEMAELTAQGFLSQPHASAGRAPTDQGFRFFVDRLLASRDFRTEHHQELDSICRLPRMGSEDLIAETARVLSELTNNVGVAMVEPLEWAPLKAIYFRESPNGMIRIIFEMADGGQEERRIKNEWALDAQSLQKLANLVNRVAAGRTLIELRRELIRQMEETKADLFLARAVELSERLMAMEQPEVFIRGQANLFQAPEFASAGKVMTLVKTFEEKALVVRMLEQAAMAPGTRVIIGEENAIEAMRGCAVITSTFGRGGMTAGAMGVIGPTRMDYARIIGLVHYSSELISECLRRNI